jgi:hypothetical protein
MATELVAPPDIEQFTTGIKKLAPKIGTIRIPGGSIIALAALAPMVDAVAEFQIKRHTKRKTKEKEKDNQKVVKVKDAIDCLDIHFRDPKTLLLFAKDLISAVVDPGFGEVDPKFWDVVADCIREKALPQTARRQRVTYRYAKREI